MKRTRFDGGVEGHLTPRSGQSTTHNNSNFTTTTTSNLEVLYALPGSFDLLSRTRLINYHKSYGATDLILQA